MPCKLLYKASILQLLSLYILIMDILQDLLHVMALRSAPQCIFTGFCSVQEGKQTMTCDRWIRYVVSYSSSSICLMTLSL